MDDPVTMYAPYELIRQDGELVWRYRGMVLTNECGYTIPLIYKDCPVLDELPPQNHSDYFFPSPSVKVFNYIKHEDLPLETLLGVPNGSTSEARPTETHSSH